MEIESSLPHSQVPPPIPILSQLGPVHTPTSHFLFRHYQYDEILVGNSGVFFFSQQNNID
jgi:hypothetical protein